MQRWKVIPNILNENLSVNWHILITTIFLLHSRLQFQNQQWFKCPRFQHRFSQLHVHYKVRYLKIYQQILIAQCAIIELNFTIWPLYANTRRVDIYCSYHTELDYSTFPSLLSNLQHTEHLQLVWTNWPCIILYTDHLNFIGLDWSSST